MSFFIERINVTRGMSESATRMKLPGSYGDRDKARQALKKVLAEYKRHGYNGEQDYWWAHDNEGRELRFVISGG